MCNSRAFTNYDSVPEDKRRDGFPENSLCFIRGFQNVILSKSHNTSFHARGIFCYVRTMHDRPIYRIHTECTTARSKRRRKRGKTE